MSNCQIVTRAVSDDGKFSSHDGQSSNSVSRHLIPGNDWGLVHC